MLRPFELLQRHSTYLKQHCPDVNLLHDARLFTSLGALSSSVCLTESVKKSKYHKLGIHVYKISLIDLDRYFVKDGLKWCAKGNLYSEEERDYYGASRANTSTHISNPLATLESVLFLERLSR